MTALLLVGVVSWRRLANTPKLMLTTPYLVFAALCVVTFGVAFASIGNLGILTRQRSLVLPLLLRVLVPAADRVRQRTHQGRHRRPHRRPRPCRRRSSRTPRRTAPLHRR